MKKTQIVFEGFTKKELDDAFDKVHFPSGDWKDPIFCRVNKKNLKAVEAAIIYF